MTQSVRQREDLEYWYGRLFRLYSTAMIWNVRKRRAAAALSRGFYALGALLAAGPHCFSARFRQGMRHDLPDSS